MDTLGITSEKIFTKKINSITKDKAQRVVLRAWIKKISKKQNELLGETVTAHNQTLLKIMNKAAELDIANKQHELDLRESIDELRSNLNSSFKKITAMQSGKIAYVRKDHERLGSGRGFILLSEIAAVEQNEENVVVVLKSGKQIILSNEYKYVYDLL